MCHKEFCEKIDNLKKVVSSGRYAKCSCPVTACEWWGDCHGCIQVHRYQNDHMPNCLQHILIDKITAIAQTAELQVTPKQKDTKEEWDHYRSKPK